MNATWASTTPDSLVADPVIDFNDPSSKRALEQLEREDIRRLLFKAALWFTQAEAEAEDLLADATNCVCDPDKGRPWDPARGSFTAHMRIVMRDLRKRERGRARTRREVLGSSLAFDADAPDSRPEPDDALSDARGLARLRRLGGILRERISHKPRTLRVFDLGGDGIEDAGELAGLIGCTVPEVYDANRQIAYHAGKILAEEEQAEAEQMKTLREQARKNKELK